MQVLYLHVAGGDSVLRSVLKSGLFGRGAPSVWAALVGVGLGWVSLPALSAQEFTTQFGLGHSEARYTFSVNQDSALSVYSVLGGGATCGDTGFGILSADGSINVVAPSQFAGCDPAVARGPWPLQAGDYQLVVWNNSGSQGNYTARLNLAPASGGADAEANNTPATALPLALGQVVTGHLGYRNGTDVDSVDYYRIEVTEAGALTLPVSSDASLPASARYVTVYLADGETVVRDVSSLQPGTYVVGIAADTYYAQAHGGYTLEAQFLPASGPVVVPGVAGTVVSGNVGLSDRYVVLQSVFTPSAADVASNTPLNVYQAAYFMGQFYFFVQVDEYHFSLHLYTGGEPPVYASAGAQDMANRTWTLGLFDVSGLVPPGFDLYSGFGRSLGDMLDRGQVRLAHSVH